MVKHVALGKGMERPVTGGQEMGPLLLCQGPPTSWLQAGHILSFFEPVYL